MKQAYFLFIVLMFFGCEETIQLDLTQSTPRIVIDGLVTTQENQQYVKISRSLNFYDVGIPELISNAIVQVSTDDGEVHPYKLSEPGIYLPEIPFKGEIGKVYKLTVEIDNQTYESEEQLLKVTSIDSLGYRLNPNPDKGRIEKGHLYDLLMYFNEPKETKDNYFFKFYRNDSLAYNNMNDIYVTSDDALGESISGYPSPVYYSEKDTARMEMYSLSRNGYLFYSDLTNLLYSDGGLFGPVPANPRSNISNGALGFFQVSDVSTSEVIIKKE
jgi:hypothetical protein